ncbi:MAG: gluconate 2-dehydrogenase subunit 3 family protein [Rhodothermales bacterium]
MPLPTEQDRPTPDRREANLITRREAIKRVSLLLGGTTLIGGSALLTGCRDGRAQAPGVMADPFTDEEIAFLDEVAETILPETSTPGAKAAETGAFMALMVTDTYTEEEQQTFRDGMKKLDEACQEMHNASFMEATPEQRLALLEQLDQEQMEFMQARAERQTNTPADSVAADAPADTVYAEAADSAQADAFVPGQRQENTPGAGAGAGATITAYDPVHYFRMMKELALLGYFTSEIGYTQAMRYVETPGRYDPCAPYEEGDKAWAPHA